MYIYIYKYIYIYIYITNTTNNNDNHFRNSPRGPAVGAAPCGRFFYRPPDGVGTNISLSLYIYIYIFFISSSPLHFAIFMLHNLTVLLSNA